MTVCDQHINVTQRIKVKALHVVEGIEMTGGRGTCTAHPKSGPLYAWKVNDKSNHRDEDVQSHFHNSLILILLLK